MKKYLSLFTVIILTANAVAQTSLPAITAQAKPWTRWWWMGSAADEKNITTLLQQYSKAGFGGTEIVPIYGAKGFESRYVKYLSKEWMQLLDHTVAQSAANNMGVYISVGTGWPIGGTHVTPQDAASKLLVQQYSVKANVPLAEKIIIKDEKQKAVAALSALMGYDAAGNAINLTDKLQADGTLQYNSSTDLSLYAIYTGKTKQMVKRAAPGGEGLTIDHFSKTATANYFKLFDSAFGNTSHGVKAFFNDSYEVYNADWTPAFFDEFKKRRGYDLKNYFNIFFSNSTSDTVARLKSDYRETISDLMRENFSTVFTQWTNKRKTLSVNQAHGSPGNLLDLYGAFDIPECETFGSSYFAVRGLRRDSADIRNVDPDPNMLKFASSAAHVYGKPLTSCETFTWLGEHFKTSWSQCKPEVDQVFLSGVNHVFYHGTTYSPQDAVWPGWLFYASVQFNPTNSIWPHLRGLNNYIARCQSVLQAGEPDNDLLVYWPVFDAWHNAKGIDKPMAIHGIDEWLHPTAFYKNVVALQQKGFSLDYVSDKMLEQTFVQKTMIQVSAKGAKYKVLVVPACDKMPEATFKNLLRIAEAGATVVIQGLPKQVPGFNNFSVRTAAMEKLMAGLNFKEVIPGTGIKKAAWFAGKVVLCNDVAAALEYLGYSSEKMAATGLQFIKRKATDGKYYFIVNNTAKDFDGDVALNTTANTVLQLNPLDGVVTVIPFSKRMTASVVRLQLKSGQSVIIKCSNKKESTAKHMYTTTAGAAISLQNNNWTLQFKDGGPVLPAEKKITTLQPWTNFADDATTQSYSGTGVYSTTFTVANKAADYLLQLDKLHESARIIINGVDAGLIWSLPYELKVGKYIKQGVNTISIEVCNLMANRIRNMDRDKEVWRNYHEINFVNINYKSFDASNWKVLPSGLDGDVKLIPLK